MSQPRAHVEHNPYLASQVVGPAKPTAAEACDVKHRSLVMVVVLSMLTLGIGYPIYLYYQWSRELNGLTQYVKHAPNVVLALSIVTLGLAGLIYEVIFAHEATEHLRRRGHKGDLPNVAVWVGVLNAIAVVFAFTGIGIVVSIPVGIAATCLVQAQFNKLAQQ